MLLVAGPALAQVPDDVPLKSEIADDHQGMPKSTLFTQSVGKTFGSSGTMATSFGEDGPDVNVSNLAGDEAEVSIAVNPTNRNNLVIAGHAPGSSPVDFDDRFATMNTFYSMDGGKTWTLVALGDSEDGFTSTFRFDPTVTIAGDGNVYVGYGLDDADGKRYLVVARSTNGGVSYDQFTTVAVDNSLDKWILGSGPDSDTAGQFNVYFAYRITEASGVNTRLASSYDQATTFSADQKVNDSGDLNTFGMPAVGPNGEVYVVWDDMTNRPTSSSIRVDVSTDDGASFGSDVLVSTTPITRGNSVRYNISAAPSRGVLAVPSIAVDRSGGAHNGRVYVSYTAKGSGAFDDTDTAIRYSDDQGSTWSSEIIVNDDGTTTSQFLPWVTVDQVTGQVVVVWYDTRNDPTNNQKTEVFMGVSNDGGVTFKPNIVVSDGQSDESGNWSNDYLEYIGVAARNGVAFPVWADNSLDPNDLDFFTDQVPIGDPPVANAGSDQSLECESTSGTVVTLDGSGSSDPNGDDLTYTWREDGVIIAGPTANPTVTVSLERGLHEIELEVDDGNLLIDTDDVLITVVDTTDPEVTINGDAVITLEAGVDPYTELGATVSDACDSDPVLVIDNSAVDPSTVGEYTVTYTVTDDAGLTDTATRTVNVIDTIPPDITVGADPVTLWPPTHKYETIDLDSLSIAVSDAGDPTVTGSDVAVTTIWSDEEEDARGGGDGFTVMDIQIDEASCRTALVRAERNARENGRVYTFTLKVADASGNVGVNKQYQVHVPQDIEVSPLGVDDGQIYTFTAAACEPASSTSAGSVAEVNSTDANTSTLDKTAHSESGLEEVSEYELSGNYPNPFNPTTLIGFALPETRHVRILVYDTLGRVVDDLVNKTLPAGRHQVRFDGQGLPSGTYFYRIEAGPFAKTNRLTLLK